MNLGSQKGTYALIFQANQEFACKVGKRGNFKGHPGSYVYLGSAFGAGGVGARLSHHLKLSSNPHWHLDYIRPYMQPVAVCYSNSPIRQEHQWATVISNIANAECPMHKFGSSDCACSSHLFYSQKIQMTTILQRTLRNDMHNPLELHIMKLKSENIARICNL